MKEIYKCQWCGAEKKIETGLCTECYRFPNNTIDPTFLEHTSDIRKTKKAIQFVVIKDKETIISFLSNLTPDYKGRTIESMINLSDEELELCHDQIQWMFPLHEESNFAFTYPVVTPDIMVDINRNLSVIYWMRMSLYRMAKFYGFQLGPDSERIVEWCQPYNHNMLRITRIIRSLRLFNLDNLAIRFHKDCIKAVEFMERQLSMSTKNSRIVQTFDFTETKRFWDKALNEPVWNTLKEPKKVFFPMRLIKKDKFPDIY